MLSYKRVVDDTEIESCPTAPYSNSPSPEASSSTVLVAAQCHSVAVEPAPIEITVSCIDAFQ